MKRLFMLLACIWLQACSSVPVASNGVIWKPSPNFDQRRPNWVIIHHTSNNDVDKALQTLTTANREVSAHYLVGRNGQVFQLVDESARAWHAGKSWWGGNTDLNSSSIGIELDNNGAEPFSEAQIQSLLDLLATLKQRYKIPDANFLGHADVAPGRKVDPSAWFPWQRLARQGFGLWCDQTDRVVPEGFDLEMGLAALGYDPVVPVASRYSFRLHFFGNGGPPPLESEKAMLYCLLNKRQGSARE